MQDFNSQEISIDLRPQKTMNTAPMFLASDAALLARLSRSKQDNYTAVFPAGFKKNLQAISLRKPTTVIKQTKSRITIGCWKVRSVKEEATQSLLVHGMDKYIIDILCVFETGIYGSGSTVITVPDTFQRFHFY